MPEMLDFTRPHVLRTEDEYGAAVAEVDRLLDLDPAEGTEEYDLLLFLSVLIEAYETEKLPAPSATPAEVVDFMLEQHGETRADLAELMGGRSRVSEFFAGKRPLSLGQARRLTQHFGISLDLLFAAGASG